MSVSCSTARLAWIVGRAPLVSGSLAGACKVAVLSVGADCRGGSRVDGDNAADGENAISGFVARWRSKIQCCRQTQRVEI